jgi:hypothetical protein
LRRQHRSLLCQPGMWRLGRLGRLGEWGRLLGNVAACLGNGVACGTGQLAGEWGGLLEPGSRHLSVSIVSKLDLVSWLGQSPASTWRRVAGCHLAAWRRVAGFAAWRARACSLAQSCRLRSLAQSHRLPQPGADSPARTWQPCLVQRQWAGCGIIGDRTIGQHPRPYDLVYPATV